MTSRIMRALLPTSKSPASPASRFNRGLSSVEPGSRSDQIQGSVGVAIKPAHLAPYTDDKWPSLQTRRNPHNQHLPKTTHNIPATILRFKTRRPVEGHSAEEKPHEETSDVSIPPPSLAPPFFFLIPSLCFCLRLLHLRWQVTGLPDPRRLPVV